MRLNWKSYWNLLNNSKKFSSGGTGLQQKNIIGKGVGRNQKYTEENVSSIFASVENLKQQGMTQQKACKEVGIGDKIYCYLKKKYGGKK